MKYPALARVFSLVLAVLSLVTMLAGILGIGTTVSDRDDSVRDYELLESRIDTYKELSEKLKDSPTYEEAEEQYEEALSEHNKKSSEHRTDLATYTATESGMKTAEESMAMMDQIVDYALDVIKNLPSYVLDSIDSSIDWSGDSDISVEDIPEEDLVKIRQTLEDYINGDLVIPINSDEMIPEESAAQFDDYASSASNMANQVIPMYDTLTTAVDSYITGKREMNKMELENLKKGIELAVNKYELMKESEELEQQRLDNEQLKEDEEKLKSEKVHLLKNSNIEKAVDDGEDIIKASEAELKLEKENSKKEFSLRLDENILMILAGIAGFLGIFGSFEIKKSRFWLIVPVAVCAVFSAVADGLSMYLGRGQLYSALAAFAFAVIQLAIVLPKKKTYSA